MLTSDLTTADNAKEIRYDRLTHDFCASYEGNCIGYFATYLEAETALDSYVSDLMAQTAWETADAFADRAAQSSSDGSVLIDPPVDPAPEPPPWDTACRNCGGAHHIQACPSIRAKLFARAIIAPELLAEADAVLLAHHLQSFNAAYCLSHGIITPAQLAEQEAA